MSFATCPVLLARPSKHIPLPPIQSPSLAVISYLHCSYGLPSWSPCFSFALSTDCSPQSHQNNSFTHSSHCNFTPVQNPPKHPISPGVKKVAVFKGAHNILSLAPGPNCVYNCISYCFLVQWSPWNPLNAEAWLRVFAASPLPGRLLPQTVAWST